jgi:hypothetical protein
MNRFGTIAVLASGLALTNTNLYADPTVAGSTGSACSPVASPVTTNQQESVPSPKITLTGITTISGPAEALYKVAGVNQDGKQCPDKSYILKEGQEEDGVGIVTIDIKKNEVTFNNHGVRQNISLANGVAVGGKPSANDVVKSSSGGSNPKPIHNPKPGDYDYADQKTVTAPLPPSVNPASAVDAPSASYGGGIGGDTPPGHGGF